MATTPTLKDRAARRSWIAFVVLLVVSVALMGLSSNPAVREAQNGIGFAFKPIQGALDSVASSLASIGAADRRHRPPADRQRGAARRERSAGGRE